MKAKLFDAHNQFIQDHDTPEALPNIKITKRLPRLQPGSYQPPAETATFRLTDTDETGTLIYREITE